MNREEAKAVLLLYRHHTADDLDPQVIAALALAKHDIELARWLEMHCARQYVLREKFRQIPIPEGLKEQIISEHASSLQQPPRKHRRFLEAVAVVFILLAVTIGWFSFHRHPAENTLAAFQNQMAGFALRGYAMELLTEDDGKIRAYLKERQSPADYVLPGPLQQATRSGCAVEGWLNSKVSLICFQTGKPLAPGAQSDLWLFVVDEKLVENIPAGKVPQLAKVNRLITATWASGGKIYFLSTEGEVADIQKYL